MQQTEKYGFNLIDGGDDFSPAPLNENMGKVEGAIAALEQTVNGKAEEAALAQEVSARTALAQTVAGKANASTVTALTQTVNGKATTAALNESIARVEAELEERQVVAGSYTAAATEAMEIHLGFRPKLLVLGGIGLGLVFGTKCMSVFNNGTYGKLGSSHVTLTDDGFRVNASDSCFNTAGQTVAYVALR